MNSTVTHLQQPEAQFSQDEGRVQGISADSIIMVRTSRGIEPVRKAFSCLVQPLAGDLVLIDRIGSGRAYVTAVLERDSNGETETVLAFDGDVRLSSPGAIQLASDSAHILNRQFKLSSQKAVLATQELEALSERASLYTNQVRLFSKAVDVVAERLTRHLKSLISVVKGTEVRQAVNLTEQVEEVRLQRDNQTILNTRKDLQMNAERIHMG